MNWAAIIYVDHGISAAPERHGRGPRSVPRRSRSGARRPRTRARTSRAASSRRSPTWATCPVYLVKIDSGKMVRVTLPNVERLSDDERILWDETVYLTWHASSPVVVTQ